MGRRSRSRRHHTVTGIMPVSTGGRGIRTVAAVTAGATDTAEGSDNPGRKTFLPADWHHQPKITNQEAAPSSFTPHLGRNHDFRLWSRID